MNLYKEQMLKHGVEWRKHKYIRKEGNRYIYPEDVKNKATAAANIAENLTKGAATVAGTKLSNMKDKATSAIADQKQKSKDREFVTGDKTLVDKAKRKLGMTKTLGRDANKETAQLTNAHQRSTRVNPFGDSFYYARGKDNDVVDVSNKGNSVEKQKKKTEQRKQAAINVKSEAQRKSAHAGYEADKKLFPEGGSTDELEWQKERTAARKKVKEQTKKKEKDQIRSAHQQHTIRERRKSLPGPAAAPSLEQKKKETEYRKWKEKQYPKQKYSADQTENERHKAAPTLSKDYRDAMGYAPSLDEQIEKTKKRKKVKYVRSLYNN